MPNRGSNFKRAVAMAYRSEDGAPKVVAKGSGPSAEAIIALAQEHGVYVHRSPELVGLLMQIQLDAEIPPELYQAVAEILAWLYALDQNSHSSHELDSSSR